MEPTSESASPAPGTTRPPVLAMRDITKSFPGVRALDGVSLSVRAGEVHALLGENGAGKSTLCNVLSGVFSEYGGSIEFNGEPVSIHHPKDAQRLGIGMIHQELNLVPELSIADNIFLGREHRTAVGTINRPEMHRRAAELMARLGLRLDPRRPVRQCRIAEQQLIEVAKALSLNVRVLIMDEPTSALAEAEVERLFAVIRTLTEQGVAVVYISHRLEELAEIADRVTVLRDGTYVATRQMAEADRTELIQLMVGRPVGEHFARETAGDGGSDVRLRVEDLTVEADTRTGRAALHGVNLSVRAGEIVGLAGLMGAGRTEIVEAVFGAFGRSVVRGRFQLNGRRYQPRSPGHAIRSGVALVAEDRKTQSLVLGGSVLFNATLSSLGSFRGWSGVNGAAQRRAVREQVSNLRVKTPSVHTTVANLSGGNQQKVVLAKCLLTKPSVLLMDEPTRGIDVGAKSEIYELMGQLAARGTAVVMVSSELPELLAMCDRIVVLCEGRVTAELDRDEANQETILDAAMARDVVLANGNGHTNGSANGSVDGDPAGDSPTAMDERKGS